VRTDRGVVRARAVINATESYTALLQRRYGQLIHPVQTQAAFGPGGPDAMTPHLGLSGKAAFFGRHEFPGVGTGVMVGSDATRVPARHAGRNAPSRFITKFCLAELRRYFQPDAPVHITHEWSGTPGFTVDEYPVVGRLDGGQQWIIGGMCGSGSAVSFNGARHVVQQILGLDGPDDYPASYFAPSRLLDPSHHPWPAVEATGS
jgi:glycine/D-amino acid oxidase-like deaminating enzyme